MEPKQPELSGGYEYQPPQGESESGYAADTEHLQDRIESRHEMAQGQRIEAEPKPSVVPTVLPTPIVSDDDIASTLAPDDMTTLSAADEDLIEKEWVDKAKKIISETKDDPYRREQEINKLQIDYIRKRYGREIGETSD